MSVQGSYELPRFGVLARMAITRHLSDVEANRREKFRAITRARTVFLFSGRLVEEKAGEREDDTERLVFCF